MKGGYVGKLARIDLTHEKVTYKLVENKFAKRFIGGRGFGAAILWKEALNANPLSENNKLIIATGPLTGIVPSGAKTSFCAISPQTNFYGDSNVGGYFGTALKMAGFDGLILEGKSNEPIYLLIKDGEIQFRDARKLWGRGSLEVERKLKSQFKRGKGFLSIATIGPAGENLVGYSCVTCDEGRQAGRTGMGAVMGSKRVKAIVVKGTNSIPVANNQKLKEICKRITEYLLKNQLGLKMWQRQGTMQVIAWSQANCCLPFQNFADASFPDYEKISGDYMEKHTKKRNRGCFNCLMACGQVNYAKGIEIVESVYETTAMVGANCGINKLEDVIYINYLCDELGLDTISAGNVGAFAMECYERGLITREDIEGIDLKFGNADALFEFLQKLVGKGRVNQLFSQGVKRAAQLIGKGSERFAMHVKGLEISGYEHRAAPAMALAYATADIGAHHNRAWAITYDIGVASKEDLRRAGISKPEFGRNTYGLDKAKWVIFLQHARPLFDCWGVCRLPWVELGLPLEWYAEAYTAATGIEMNLKNSLKASERIYNLTRLINLKRGLKGEDDWLPDRVFEEPLKSKPYTGTKLDKRKFRKLLNHYYRLRGWDKKGIPTDKKLRELGLLR